MKMEEFDDEMCGNLTWEYHNIGVLVRYDYSGHYV